MTNKPEKKGLGRGLSALISPASVNVFRTTETNTVGNAAIKTQEALPDGVRFVDINLLVRNESQPRQEFAEKELLELSNSLKSLGILQPILVRRRGGNLEVVAGERRWRAAKLAGLNSVPVIEKSLSDLDTLQIALVENIQRSQLTPIEEARGYERLVNEFGLSQDQVAEMVGKNRVTVSNSIRILKLPEQVLALLREDKISLGHAKVILSVKEPAVQINLAKKCASEALSVRALEQIVSTTISFEPRKKLNKVRAQTETKYPEITDRLRNALGTRVTIEETSEGKGKIKIDYYSEAELTRIIEEICS